MLNDLESGLQRLYERHGPYEMFQELKLIFQENTRVERYEVSKKYIAKRWRRIAQAVSMCLDCLGTTIT